MVLQRLVASFLCCFDGHCRNSFAFTPCLLDFFFKNHTATLYPRRYPNDKNVQNDALPNSVAWPTSMHTMFVKPTAYHWKSLVSTFYHYTLIALSFCWLSAYCFRNVTVLSELIWRQTVTSSQYQLLLCRHGSTFIVSSIPSLMSAFERNPTLNVLPTSQISLSKAKKLCAASANATLPSLQHQFFSAWSQTLPSVIFFSQHTKMCATKMAAHTVLSAALCCNGENYFR